MLINSITLTNFQCYYGVVMFEFKKGLNVVIGDNGAGKSKLYDAFYWVLYDQIFDSLSREFKKTSQIKDGLISDKAKALCEPGSTVKTEVELIVYNSKRGEEYTLSRSYVASKTEFGELLPNSESSFSIIYTNKHKTSRPIVTLTDINTLLKTILPDDVKPYMWFQGEQVDSLIDFKNNSTLTNAINVLSDIREFDFYLEVSKKASDAADKEYYRELKKASSDTKKIDELENKKSIIQRDLGRLDAEKREVESNLTYAEEKKENLYNKVEGAQKIKELNTQKTSLKERLMDVDNQLLKMMSRINKSLISRNWVLKEAGFLVDLFEKKYDQYIQTKIKQEAENHAKQKALQELHKEFRLPVDVPEPIFVKQMLEKERCFVCDREAKKNSEAYNKIQQLLERSKIPKGGPKPIPITKYDFSKEFKSLYQNGLNLKGVISYIDYEIKSDTDNIRDRQAKSKILENELKDIQQKTEEAISASSVGSLEYSIDIVNEFQSLHEQIVKLEKQLERLKYDIEVKEKEVNSIEEELKALSKGKIPPKLEEKKKVLKDFHDIAKSTRERMFNKLIQQLEKEANEHFNNMTKENQSARGKITLEKQANGNYMPKNTDSDGRILTSINDSNIILIKLAVIMAIISAKKGSPAADLYTLITDAPTSKFGDNYTIGFCRTASQVYNQSIVISKDFYLKPDLLNRLLSEVGDNLGNIYQIEPSLSEEAQRDHRDELEISLIKIR